LQHPVHVGNLPIISADFALRGERRRPIGVPAPTLAGRPDPPRPRRFARSDAALLDPNVTVGALPDGQTQSLTDVEIVKTGRLILPAYPAIYVDRRR
jgi:hypothetical protein